jgi:hypothetical protein
MYKTLSDDLEEEIAVGNFYLHENLSKPSLDFYRLLIYRIISLSDDSAKVEIYDRNGIRLDTAGETDFEFQENENIISLMDFLNDKRVSNDFRIKRFSYLQTT